MQKIIIASTNPVKIECVRRGFERMFPDFGGEFTGVDVPSGVSEQPYGDDETRQGACNRAANARATYPEGDYWVGIEGGVDDTDSVMSAFAWMIVLSDNRQGSSRTASFTLPDEVAVLVRQGVELGHADDALFKRSNSKQGNGAVGILTHDAMDRTEFYAAAIVLALIPFANPDLTFPQVC